MISKKGFNRAHNNGNNISAEWVIITTNKQMNWK